MGARIEIDPAARLVASFFDGDFSLETFAEARNQLQAAPLFDPTFSYIIDLSNITKGSLKPEQIQEFAAQPSILAKESIQIIVAPDPETYQLVRLYQTYAAEGRPNIHVVKSLQEAYARVRGLRRGA